MVIYLCAKLGSWKHSDERRHSSHGSSSTTRRAHQSRDHSGLRLDDEVAQIVSHFLCSRGKCRVPTETTLKFRSITWKPLSHADMDSVSELVVTAFCQSVPKMLWRLLQHEVFYRLGLPKKIWSHWDSELNNVVLRSIMDTAPDAQALSRAHQIFHGTMIICLSRILKNVSDAWFWITYCL